MTEFVFEPIKKIIIQNIIQETLDNFLHQCYSRSQTECVWTDGIILDVQTFMKSDGAYTNMTDGIKYWEKLSFVKFPKYQKSVKWNGGNFELIVLNYNNNSRHKSLAKWIKSHPVWKTIPEDVK